MSQLHEKAKELARSLRKNQTKAETILWNRLRNRQFLGKKFLRQHPIFYEYLDLKGFHIADFYCHECRLVVEVDGKIHDYRQEDDRIRTELLETNHMRVLRVQNDDIEKDLHGVLGKIKDALTHPPSPPSLEKRRGMGG